MNFDFRFSILGVMPEPSSAAATGWFVLTAVGIMSGLLVALKLAREVKNWASGPEKRDVRITSECATIHDLKEHVQWDAKEHEKLWSKVGGVERGADGRLSDEMKELRRERGEDAVRLQEKLSEVDQALGGLEKSTELQNQSLAGIQATLLKLLQGPNRRGHD